MDAVERPAGRDALLQRLQVGLGDRLVVGQREHERDVHVQAGSHGAADGRDTRFGGRDLDHHVRTGDRLGEAMSFGEGLVRLRSQPGRNLDAYETVGAARLLVHAIEFVAGGVDVCDRQRVEDVVGVESPAGKFDDLVVVVVAGTHGLLEDGRVGCHAPQPVFVDEAHQPAAADQVAADEVEPDALTLLEKAAHAIASVSHG